MNTIASQKYGWAALTICCLTGAYIGRESEMSKGEFLLLFLSFLVVFVIRFVLCAVVLSWPLFSLSLSLSLSSLLSPFLLFLLLFCTHQKHTTSIDKRGDQHSALLRQKKEFAAAREKWLANKEAIKTDQQIAAPGSLMRHLSRRWEGNLASLETLRQLASFSAFRFRKKHELSKSFYLK